MFKIDAFDDELKEIKSAKLAQKFALRQSGRDAKPVAFELGMSEGHFSRCLDPNDSVNIPHDKLVQFMLSCRNVLYIRWLYLKVVGLLPELENDDAACIADMFETLRLELREAMAGIKAALPQSHCKCCGAAQFSFSAPDSDWQAGMVWCVWEMEEEFGRVL